ncbi:protocadherin gamma-C5-like isoform X7 [Polypterus senegalus]|uniref:protocadherin gamma-C5-like isoform X7 n=1 Tax=Polypterus senegalus TaxID=55291 RepID=UPI0019642B13|nr:protocadherin gamma-C5-like isoform X7 [Polypterus senegalus]
MPLEIIIENPLQLYRVEVEIQDINDNSPSFLSSERTLKIAESTTRGARFPLDSASDPDVGSNALKSYFINPNEYFVLNTKTRADGSKVPELILEKALDRETVPIHTFDLTAVDGGSPPKSGTIKINVVVLDNNDNMPEFDKPEYKLFLKENSPKGTVAGKVSATDLDEGLNGEVVYSLDVNTPEAVRRLFNITELGGEVVVQEELDFEEVNSFKFDIRARDKGNPEMEGFCSMHIEIVDVNDNAPEIIFTSLPSPIQESAPVGTVIALIRTRDLDSGDNGRVILQLHPDKPFKLQPSFANNYALVTSTSLDREAFPEYKVDIIAKDSGTPVLSTKKTLTVTVLDVNDNPPTFAHPSYSVYTKENNTPGSVLCAVSATDPDLGTNSQLSYSIVDTTAQGTSLSSFVYINSENGNIHTLNSFDYEQVKNVEIQVQVTDNGSPPLHSNATVHLFILDENDNAPVVLYPPPDMGSLPLQKISRSVKAGHLVTKVTAVDADAGHNAWISYQLLDMPDNPLYTISQYTGEIRTRREVTEQDGAIQGLTVEIKDNGQPALSATVSVEITLEDGSLEPMLDVRDKSHSARYATKDVTLYLIISLAAVSAISFLTFIILLVKCARNGRANLFSNGRTRSEWEKNSQRNLHIQLNSDGPIKYVEVVGGDMLSQSQSYRSCFSQMTDASNFTISKSMTASDFTEIVSPVNTSIPGKDFENGEYQQKPANAEWRFTQGQRPGTSGTQRPEEAGPWPNPPTEAEQLQALMAAANEVSEATGTLGAGTMGLSTRYSPQFTLQHVPDYRQNVYIPGSTTTLAGNNAQPDAKIMAAAAPTASKKKPGKKEKK